MTVWALLIVAGMSEASGRIVPVVVRRHFASRPAIVRLLLAGTVVEAMVFAVWPLTGWIFAGLIKHGTPNGAQPAWTMDSVAPLLLAGVLAFPLLGPVLHLVVLVLAGTALAGDLSATERLGWWSAIACVASSRLLLAVLVGAVRQVVGGWGSTPERVWTL